MHILVQLRIYAPHICDCAYYRVTSFFLVFLVACKSLCPHPFTDFFRRIRADDNS